NLAPPGCEMSSLRAFTEIHLQAFFTGPGGNELPVLHRRAFSRKCGNEMPGFVKRRRTALHGDGDSARAAQNLCKALGERINGGKIEARARHHHDPRATRR